MTLPWRIVTFSATICERFKVSLGISGESWRRTTPHWLWAGFTPEYDHSRDLGEFYCLKFMFSIGPIWFATRAAMKPSWTHTCRPGFFYPTKIRPWWEYLDSGGRYPLRIQW